MPDQALVNIGDRARSLAATIRNIHTDLYDIQDAAYPIAPVIASILTLLLGLREKLNAGELAGESLRQTLDSVKSLETFYYSARRLEKLSGDIANKPSVHDRGELESQWDERCRGLLDLTNPVSQILDSLSDMASSWPPVVLPAAGSVRGGEASAGADAGTRSGTRRKKKAG